VKTHLSVPYLGMDADGNTTRCWAHLTWEGKADRRKIKRHVHAWVRHELQRHLHSSELRSIMKRRVTYTGAAPT
jgi:hypothetical protein